MTSASASQSYDLMADLQGRLESSVTADSGPSSEIAQDYGNFLVQEPLKSVVDSSLHTTAQFVMDSLGVGVYREICADGVEDGVFLTEEYVRRLSQASTLYSPKAHGFEVARTSIGTVDFNSTQGVEGEGEGDTKRANMGKGGKRGGGVRKSRRTKK